MFNLQCTSSPGTFSAKEYRSSELDTFESFINTCLPFILTSTLLKGCELEHRTYLDLTSTYLIRAPQTSWARRRGRLVGSWSKPTTGSEFWSVPNPIEVTERRSSSKRSKYCSSSGRSSTQLINICLIEPSSVATKKKKTTKGEDDEEGPELDPISLISTLWSW